MSTRDNPVAKYKTVKDWLQTKALEGRSPRTCECYRQTVDRFGKWTVWNAPACRGYIDEGKLAKESA